MWAREALPVGARRARRRATGSAQSRRCARRGPRRRLEMQRSRWSSLVGSLARFPSSTSCCSCGIHEVHFAWMNYAPEHSPESQRTVLLRFRARWFNIQKYDAHGLLKAIEAPVLLQAMAARTRSCPRRRAVRTTRRKLRRLACGRSACSTSPTTASTRCPRASPRLCRSCTSTATT